MDTVRLKFKINFDKINSYFFFQKIKHKEIISSPVNKGSSRFIFTNNDWRKEREQKEIYTPKYWIEEDFIASEIKYLVIELSIPKLLYGTSAIKPKEKDLLLAVDKIKNFLKEIGFNFFSRQILDATPITVSFGENVDITKICSCYQAIGILSSFNDRFRSDIYTYQPNKGGVELYYNTKSSTFKAYDKLKEIKNNTRTKEEGKIVEAYLTSGYGKEKVWICELLRFELTLKNKDSIQKRLKQYLGSKITFENMFKENIWFDLLKTEIDRIYNQPINDFIFLSKLQSPEIKAFLNKNVKSFKTRAIIKEVLEIIQTNGGIKGLKEFYFKNYKSKKTYYNHLAILSRLAKIIDFSEIENLTTSKIHKFLLNHFGIKITYQGKLI